MSTNISSRKTLTRTFVPIIIKVSKGEQIFYEVIIMNKLSVCYILTFIVSILAITLIVSYTGADSLENYHKVEIKEGDSLWSIADEFQKKTEISKQDFVKWVQEKNNIHSTLIKPGDLVVVPIEKNDFYHIEQIASE